MDLGLLSNAMVICAVRPDPMDHWIAKVVAISCRLLKGYVADSYLRAAMNH